METRMSYNDDSILKRVLVVVVATIGVILLSSITAFFVAKGETNKVQRTLVTTIKSDLGDYLADYQGIGSSSSGTVAPDGSGPIQLSQDQIDEIVEAVTQTIEYGLIRDTISQYSTVSEENLAHLEKTMNEKVSSVLESSEKTRDLTQTEKETIVNSISTIIKEDLLKMMSEYQVGNTKDILLLKESLSKDVSNLQASLKEYQTTLNNLQTKVNELSSKSNNSASDSTIKDLEGKITANNTQIKTDVADAVNNAKAELEGKITANNAQIKADVADAVNNAKAELEGKITANNEQIKKDVTDAVNTAKTELEAKIAANDATVQQLETKITNLTNENNAFQIQVTESINNAKAQLQAKIDANEKAIQQLEGTINTANQALEQQMDLMAKEIESINNILTKDSTGAVTKISYDSGTNTVRFTQLNPQQATP